MKTILLTGSEGYIGSSIKNEILKEPSNYSLTCADHELGSDIMDFRDHSFDVLIHLAAFTSVAEAEKDPARYYLNNCEKFQFLVDNNHFGSIIYSSSASIYNVFGDISPEGTYGNTKLAGEYIAQSNKNCIVMRFANPVGVNLKLHSVSAIKNSRESHPNVFWALAKAKVNNTVFEIHNVKNMKRDFFPLFWIRDFVMESLVNDIKGKAIGDICSTQHVFVIFLLKSLCEEYGIRWKLVDPPKGISEGYKEAYKGIPLIPLDQRLGFNPIEYCKKELANYIRAVESIKE